MDFCLLYCPLTFLSIYVIFTNFRILNKTVLFWMLTYPSFRFFLCCNINIFLCSMLSKYVFLIFCSSTNYAHTISKNAYVLFTSKQNKNIFICLNRWKDACSMERGLILTNRRRKNIHCITLKKYKEGENRSLWIFIVILTFRSFCFRASGLLTKRVRINIADLFVRAAFWRLQEKELTANYEGD